MDQKTHEDENALSLIDISMRGVPKEDREKYRRMQALKERRLVRREKLRKKIMKGSAASMLGLSITLAGLFPSSSDLLTQQTIRQLQDTTPVEMVLEEEDLPGSGEDERRKEAAGVSGKGFWSRLLQAVRNLVLKLPLWVRTCVLLPLWAVGSLVLVLLSGVYRVVLAPVLSHILGYILCAAIMLGVFVLTMKSIFPDMPLKKILRWKNIRWILLGAAVLKLLDIFLPLFWGNYTRWKYLFLFGAGCLILGINVVPRMLRAHKKTQLQP